MTTAAKKAPRAKAAPEVPGIILPDAIYRLRDFQRIAGLKSWAMRRARRLGLRVLRFGNARYVRGGDFLAFLAEHGNDAEGASE